MKQLTCTVERIIYRSEENGYSVLRCMKGRTPVVIVGTLPTPMPGVVLTCSGDWRNSQYGEQFVVQKYQEKAPASRDGVEKYLSSGFIKGVGPALAAAIVNQFGDDTIKIIENEPQRLREVPGIGEVKLENIVKSWKDNIGIKNVMIFLQGHGVGTSLAFRIYLKYEDESIEKIESNPYILAEELDGVGFTTADTIAASLGITGDNVNRLMAGLRYSLREAALHGNVYLPEEELLKAAKELLSCNEDPLRSALTDMKKAEILRADEDCIYIPSLYHSERGVARRITDIYVRGGNVTNEEVRELLKDSEIQYDDVQLQAIRTALNASVMVLTGGPGTGKTTTVSGIIHALKKRNEEVLLAAPTGRAAKRMKEATGMPAKTIHRLLEYNPRAGFVKCELDRLKGDTLIVDECSMIDIPLMNNLLKAIPPGMRLILVGDIDQLPSVGVGNVLRDIIDSGAVSVVRLTRIFRQAAKSRIITNAHAINEGHVPELDNSADSDFFFISEENAEAIPDQIISLVRDRLPAYYKCKPEDIQVLSPMRRGTIGTETLNKAMQRVINPVAAYLSFRGTEYRKGDRVMQVRNNYDKGVFNGDLGYITEVDDIEDTLVIDYDGHNVKYKRIELEQVVLAYACTIHKSQGSEYPVVIIPMHTCHYIMLQRNLLYTGVTRAKKACVIIGSPKAMLMAVNNQPVLKRYTKLKSLIWQESACK